MTYPLSHKQLLELKFWIEERARDNYAAERAKLPLYLEALGLPAAIPGWGSQGKANVLEIGTGPYWGLLQYMHFADFGSERWLPARLMACDPLFPAFDACGLLEHRGAIQRVDEPFEYWDTDSEQFDAIITCNALDHGEMGWYLLPKIWRLLKPGGKLFLHVHLRPTELLNLVHDHALTLAGMEKALKDTGLVQESRRLYRKDVDGQFCEAVVGVWHK